MVSGGLHPPSTHDTSYRTKVSNLFLQLNPLVDFFSISVLSFTLAWIISNQIPTNGLLYCPSFYKLKDVN